MRTIAKGRGAHGVVCNLTSYFFLTELSIAAALTGAASKILTRQIIDQLALFSECYFGVIGCCYLDDSENRQIYLENKHFFENMAKLKKCTGENHHDDG